MHEIESQQPLQLSLRSPVPFSSSLPDSIQQHLIIEQYHALREEVIHRVNARQAMWSTLLVLAGTLLTVGVQPAISAWTAVLYPLISLCLALNWGHNDLRIGQLVWYLQYQVERPLQLEGWESYRARMKRHKGHILSSGSGLHTYGAVGVFALTQLLATGIGVARLVEGGQLLLAIIAGLCDLAALITTAWVLRKRSQQRRHHQHSQQQQ